MKVKVIMITTSNGSIFLVHEFLNRKIIMSYKYQDGRGRPRRFDWSILESQDIVRVPLTQKALQDKEELKKEKRNLTKSAKFYASRNCMVVSCKQEGNFYVVRRWFE